MSATNSFETALLNLIFANDAIANIGNASGIQPSSVDGSLYVALFTADPTESGLTANECTYTSYARVAVSRTNGWTVSGNSAENAAAITFPQATGGSETATHFAIMTASSGGDMLFSGALGSSQAIASGTTPEFAAGGLTITAD